MNLSLPHQDHEEISIINFKIAGAVMAVSTAISCAILISEFFVVGTKLRFLLLFRGPFMVVVVIVVPISVYINRPHVRNVIKKGLMSNKCFSCL